jgi:hypothetical protein
LIGTSFALRRNPQTRNEPGDQQRADREDRIARHAQPDKQMDDRLAMKSAERANQ